MSARPNWHPIEGAETLADTWCEQDPLPALAPSLLSAAYIEYYVRTTGLMDSFDTDALKSASYEVPIRGTVVYWLDERTRKVVEVKEGMASLKLEPNSITFVEVEPIFRLPQYIAIRFNLRIHHVHRGLLLGTGPLVDPGFRGKILIPLHNLTATAYDLDLRKALIWIEFTKTSYKAGALQAGPDLRVEYAEKSFPRAARYKGALQYLQQANGGFPILSSIPKAVSDAAGRAEVAEKEASKAAASLDKIRTFGLIAVLTAVGGVASLVYSSYSLVANVRTSVDTIRTSVDTDIAGLKVEVAKADAARSSLQEKFLALQKLVDHLQAEKRGARK